MKDNLIEIIEGIPLKKLSRGEKSILKLMLFWGNNETKNIGISLKNIVKFTGFSESGVVEMIKRLSEKNLLSVKKERGKEGWITNLYTIQKTNLRKLNKLNTYKNTGVKNRKNPKNGVKNAQKSYPSYPHPPTPKWSTPPTPKWSTSPYINVVNNNNQILNSTVVKQTKNLNLKKTSPISEPEKLQMLVDQYGENRVQSVMNEAQKKQFHIRNIRGWISRALHERWKFDHESNRREEGKH